MNSLSTANPVNDNESHPSTWRVQRRRGESNDIDKNKTTSTRTQRRRQEPDDIDDHPVISTTTQQHHPKPNNIDDNRRQPDDNFWLLETL
jgi:hypothetical protein